MTTPLAELSLTDPSTLCLLVLIVTTGFLLMRAGRHLARQQREAGAIPSVRAREEANGPPSANRPDELDRWTVEMHDTARALSAQLDSKMSALAALVAEADRAAARLEAALARTREAVPRADSQAEALLGVVAGGAEGAGPGVEEPDAEGRGAPLLPRADDPAPPSRAARRDEIYTLADYGFGPAEIARRVGSPIGEVELVLGLRGRT
jgi:hypothetical protein